MREAVSGALRSELAGAGAREAGITPSSERDRTSKDYL
jgi:hypothetical protein